jgi:methyl-accepting chemotaxis protein
MDLDSAIQKHAEWRLKFRQAITKHETMDAAAVAKDNLCELGKWLHGEAKKVHGTLRSYAACVTAHAAFHVEAGKIAAAINAKDYAAADKMLGAGTPYAEASSVIGGAVIGLKNETKK